MTEEHLQMLLNSFMLENFYTENTELLYKYLFIYILLLALSLYGCIWISKYFNVSILASDRNMVEIGSISGIIFAPFILSAVLYLILGSPFKFLLFLCYLSFAYLPIVAISAFLFAKPLLAVISIILPLLECCFVHNSLKPNEPCYKGFRKELTLVVMFLALSGIHGEIFHMVE